PPTTPAMKCRLLGISTSPPQHSHFAPCLTFVDVGEISISESKSEIYETADTNVEALSSDTFKKETVLSPPLKFLAS
ncbi:MAG: hypothetical protein YYHSYBAR_000373, partial [Candidatus Fervidibacter sacchari]